MSLEDKPQGGETLPGQEIEVVELEAASQDHTRVPTSVDQQRRSSESSSHSAKSHESRKADRAPAVSQLTPINRFRSAVRKVIAVHRTSALVLRGRLGAEPGVDPRRDSAFAAYGHVRQKCVIDVIDYSSIRCSAGRMSNSGFISFLQNDRASAREPWVRVRWINIGGISWDVISALAMKYDMHPLSVEDLLHHRTGHALSKADYYPNHLFIRVLCHTLGSSAQGSESDTPPLFAELPRSASPQRFNEKLSMEREGTFGSGYGGEFDPMADEFDSAKATLVDPEMGGRGASRLAILLEAHKRRRAAAELTLDELKKEDRVGVHIEPMCIFLFRDGTVVSFNSKPNLDLTEPIAARIRQRDTSLRKTADPCLLVQSLLDLVVDAALEVVDEYRTRLSMVERMILIKSKVTNVRSLHILSGDLILHKRTLGPVKALIYALRTYDAERTAACLDLSESGDEKVVGFLSPKSKIYLADVHDHIEYAMNSLDMYSAMAENLINYTFNMASYEMNEVMRRLTLCTVVFLPLTLLTGYFGMNFEYMWSIKHGHTDKLFWTIAIPVLAVVMPAFMWPDIIRIYHYVKKRSLDRNVSKGFKIE